MNHIKLCTHIKSDGTPCQAIPVTDSPYCYFHRTHYHPAGMPGQRNYRVPLLESHHSIQLATTDLYQSFVTGIIPLKEARFALQILRLASKTITEIERNAKKEAAGEDGRESTDSRVRAAAPGCATNPATKVEPGVPAAKSASPVPHPELVPKPPVPNPFVNVKLPQPPKSYTDVDLAPFQAELDRVRKQKESASK